MAERPEDLNLPMIVVQRLVKEALPDGVIVSKEARQTISRASSVFVLYLTACAVAHANKAKRKTLAVNDILSACGDMEFDSFVPDLNSALKYRKEFLAQNIKAKSTAKVAKKDAEAAEEDGAEEADDAEHDMEAEDTVADAVEEEEDEEEEAQENGEQTTKKRKLTDTVPEDAKPAEEDDAVEVDDSSEEEEEEEVL